MGRVAIAGSVEGGIHGGVDAVHCSMLKRMTGSRRIGLQTEEQLLEDDGRGGGGWGEWKRKAGPGREIFYRELVGEEVLRVESHKKEEGVEGELLDMGEGGGRSLLLIETRFSLVQRAMCSGAGSNGQTRSFFLAFHPSVHRVKPAGREGGARYAEQI